MTIGRKKISGRSTKKVSPGVPDAGDAAAVAAHTGPENISPGPDPILEINDVNESQITSDAPRLPEGSDESSDPTNLITQETLSPEGTEKSGTIEGDDKVGEASGSFSPESLPLQSDPDLSAVTDTAEAASPDAADEPATAASPDLVEPQADVEPAAVAGASANPEPGAPSTDSTPDPAEKKPSLRSARWESRWKAPVWATAPVVPAPQAISPSAVGSGARTASPQSPSDSQLAVLAGEEPALESLDTFDASGQAEITLTTIEAGSRVDFEPQDVPALLRLPDRIALDMEEDSPGAELGFQFRAKAANALTPEQAREQAEWISTPAPASRIGSRSETGRGPGRAPTHGGRSQNASRSAAVPDAADDLVPDPFAVLSERDASPGEDWAAEDPGRGDVADVVADGQLETGPGVTGDAEEREDGVGRARRRKERPRRGRKERVEAIGVEARSDTDETVDAGDLTGDEPPQYNRYVEDDMVTAEPLPFADEEQAAEANTLSQIGMDQRLGKEILVNTGARETRIAFVVAGMLSELHIEREERLVGAVCKARVDRVLPGIDAAFVDVALDRNAFLMAGDVVPEEDEDEPSSGRKPHRHASISDLVKPRQELMVQITKAPRGSKGARVSSRISLPGRYLVLMPDSETTGVSRKIDDDHERDRLKKIARAIKPPGLGVIVRTEAENKTEEELRADVQFLLRLWGQIQQKYKTARAPSIVHRDLSLTFKIIRDLFGSDVNRFVIDSKEEYDKVVELVEFISPKLRSRVALYEDPIPLFERVGIEAEIDRLFRQKIWLKSGGYLIIDETEALTTIDVNSGKFVGTTNPGQTIFKNNMEAVVEIARQLRLRDIGGMIILDFIDMSNAKDRAAVMKALDANLKKDRSRTKIAHLSPLGLVEMTRKRTGETFSEVTTELCSYCGGRGRTLNPDTVSILVEREIRKQGLDLNDEAFLVMVNPAVAPFLLGPDASNIDRLERELRRAVYVRATDNLHIEKFEVVPADMQETERQLLPYREGQVVDCVVEQSAAINLPHAIARLDGYLLDLVNGGQYLGRRVRAKLLKVGRSIASAEVVGGGRPVDKLGGN